jgi:hypothetical protein
MMGRIPYKLGVAHRSMPVGVAISVTSDNISYVTFDRPAMQAVSPVRILTPIIVYAPL